MTELVKIIDRELSAFGLRIRGIKVFDETTPIEGLDAQCVALIGHIGGENWDQFQTWWGKDDHQDLEHPLDAWSKEIINPLAKKYDGVAVFPSDEPYYPFQNWALDSELLSKSLINLLISEDFGTWHGYRGAIAFEEKLDLACTENHALDVCATCVDKPCLSACPVNAFGGDEFLYAECQSYLKTKEGEASCMTDGCSARNACPYGQQYKYKSPQMKFHMRAFRKF